MPKFTAGLRLKAGRVVRAVTRRGKSGFTAPQLAQAKTTAAKHGEKIVDVHAVAPTLTPGERIVAEARKYLGVHEIDSSNRGPQIDAWLEAAHCPPGNPWCAAFACAMWIAAGAKVPGGATASCAELREHAQAVGNWHAEPVEGAIGIFHADEHAVICTQAPHDGLDPTIAGNTSETDGANPNGGCVAAHDLPASLIAGWVHP